MGMPSTPKAVPAPPSPEPVKRTSAEATQIREDQRSAAARRYGASQTNVSGGVLEGTQAETKKTKLGGA